MQAKGFLLDLEASNSRPNKFNFLKLWGIKVSCHRRYNLVHMVCCATINLQQVIQSKSKLLLLLLLLLMMFLMSIFLILNTTSPGTLPHVLFLSSLVSRSNMKHIFHRVLAALVMFDNLYLALTFLELCRRWWDPSPLNLLKVFVAYPLRNISLCCQIYLAVMLAVERYKAIRSVETNIQ